MKEKRKPTREEIDADDDARTSPIGLYHYGQAYWKSASRLRVRPVKIIHADWPMFYLHYHAIELFLKAYLRLRGVRVRELKGKFGHDFGAIAKRAAYLGLFFEDEDLVVLDLMAKTDAVIRSRYIRSGAFTIPHPDALHRTCRSLHQSVGEELQKAGQPVRLRPYSRRRNRGHDARR